MSEQTTAIGGAKRDIAGEFCGQWQPHAAHTWAPPVPFGTTYVAIPRQCAGCSPVLAEQNRRVLRHEAETPMRGHDENGECCLRARRTPLPDEPPAREAAGAAADGEASDG